MEWVEVRGKSVEVAVEAALAELGLESSDQVEIEVLQEPTRGILGIGGQPAIVRVKEKPKRRERKRRRRGKGRSKETSGQEGGRVEAGMKSDKQGSQAGARREDRGEDVRRSRQGGSGDRAKPTGGRKPSGQRGGDGRNREEVSPPEPADVEAQRQVVAEFLEGLLEAFGLEGTIETSIEEDIVIADITGDQAEALVGDKAVILQAIGELVRTIVQRKTRHRARIRLDIGGYQARRREALRIYAQRLANRVVEEGGELMLEPMNPADRKVVHDAVLDIDGVRSFSEGEEPRRSVVIALAPGVEPRSGGAQEGEVADGDESQDRSSPEQADLEVASPAEEVGEGDEPDQTADSGESSDRVGSGDPFEDAERDQS